MFVLSVQEIGDIAQLGEQLLCKHQVVGSIPSVSTIRFAPGYDNRVRLLAVLEDLRSSACGPGCLHVVPQGIDGEVAADRK